jgi:Zn2+/Cd2+-exporting ATPase
VGGADVALLGTDLGRLPRLIGLADITRSVIGQNVWLAFGLSVVLLALAARGVLDPLQGALAQSVAVLLVVANSAGILRFANQDAPETATSVAQDGTSTDSDTGIFAKRASVP